MKLEVDTVVFSSCCRLWLNPGLLGLSVVDVVLGMKVLKLAFSVKVRFC